MLTHPLIFSRNMKRRLTNFFWLICNLLTWNHKFSERKKIRRLKRKIVERDTEIMSIMVDLTRFFLSFFITIVRTFFLLFTWLPKSRKTSQLLPCWSGFSAWVLIWARKAEFREVFVVSFYSPFAISPLRYQYQILLFSFRFWLRSSPQFDWEA